MSDPTIGSETEFDEIERRASEALALAEKYVTDADPYVWHEVANLIDNQP